MGWVGTFAESDDYANDSGSVAAISVGGGVAMMGAVFGSATSHWIAVRLDELSTKNSIR